MCSFCLQPKPENLYTKCFKCSSRLKLAKEWEECFVCKRGHFKTQEGPYGNFMTCDKWSDHKKVVVGSRLWAAPQPKKKMSARGGSQGKW